MSVQCKHCTWKTLLLWHHSVYPNCVLMNQYSLIVLIRIAFSHCTFTNDYSTSIESSRLIELSPRHNCSRCCSSPIQYRLPRIKENQAMIVIVCNVLILGAFLAQIQGNYLMRSTFGIFPPLISIILFPIIYWNCCWHSACVGKFLVLQASVALLVASFSLLCMEAMYWAPFYYEKMYERKE